MAGQQEEYYTYPLLLPFSVNGREDLRDEAGKAAAFVVRPELHFAN